MGNVSKRGNGLLSMSPLAITAIVLGSVLTYLFGSGIVYALGKERDWDFEYDITPWLAVCFWPVCLPSMLAARVTRSIVTREKQIKVPKMQARK